MKEQFIRLSGFLSDEAISTLFQKKVVVAGLGGVGGYAIEALARSGVGKFVLIDCDDIKESNLNRQIIATWGTIGAKKTEAWANRIKEINRDAEVEFFDMFYNGEDSPLVGADYIIDAIDTVTAKIKLIAKAKELHIPIVSCMGTGNKLDLTKLRVADILKTKACPLARVMRKELKLRDISDVKCVYSEEEVLKVTIGEENGRHPPMSAIFVPAAAGLMLAKVVLEDLGGLYGKN